MFSSLADSIPDARVLDLDVFTAIKRVLAPRLFEIIFADPPYTPDGRKMGDAETLFTSEDLPELLSPGGLFILEKSPRHPLPEDSNGWEVVRQKRYGASEVVFLRRQPPTT